MSRKIPPDKAHAVRELAVRHTQREIASILGVSKGSVSSILSRKAARKAASAARSSAPRTPTMPAAPTAEQVRAARRLELEAACNAAETPDGYGAAVLDLMRFDDPLLDAALASGAGLVDALLSSDSGTALLVIRSAGDLAALATGATEAVVLWGPDDGETPEQHRAWLAEQEAAALAASIELLEGALEIVRKRTEKP